MSGQVNISFDLGLKDPYDIDPLMDHGVIPLAGARVEVMPKARVGA